MSSDTFAKSTNMLYLYVFYITLISLFVLDIDPHLEWHFQGAWDWTVALRWEFEIGNIFRVSIKF